eukprot:CAMPEP_0201106922 /NCGR_PEP_ID=MMETSP0812-20130820/54025_1 /ASSEMBLY_ACC=CAM_ASM_000668 /TAXON_ID=98059 /ORGANISM="Dinobryon sp., Strain UTEXLB2267" /LENGTH=130 /DNA_ID=CAMNT_0047367515 /DNA_START=519 /DNA_END=908 /DNA_ORIENTATION=-
MVAGYLYDVDWFNIQSFRLPQRLVRFCAAIGSFFSSVNTTNASLTAPRGAGRSTQATNRRPQSSQFDSNASSATNLMGNSSIRHRPPQSSVSSISTPLPPDEESISMLMGMGFDRDSVVRALLMTGNNVE